MPARRDLWAEWRTLLEQPDPDPLEVARLASAFERYFDAVKTAAVRAARDAGHTWEDVAATLGTSRQSAWQRYRFRERVKTREWLSIPRWPPRPDVPPEAAR